MILHDSCLGFIYKIDSDFNFCNSINIDSEIHMDKYERLIYKIAVDYTYLKANKIHYILCGIPCSNFQIPIIRSFINIILSKMEENYKILPKRNGKSDGSFKRMRPINFYTNFYNIDIDTRKSTIYQYSFSLPEDIPHDSEIYQCAINSIKKTLKDKIGYLAHTGQMIWGKLSLKVPTTFQCQFNFQENKYSLESVVKQTKELDLRDLNQDKTRPIYIQILNVNLKNMFNSIGLNQPGKNGQYFASFDPKDSNLYQLRDKGLKILKGFKFTLSYLNSGIFLQIDVCSKVLQERNLLQIFNGKPLDYNKQRFIGSTVITNYGRCKTYQVEDIDYKITPLSTFYHEKNKKEISYMDYYKDVYGLKISNTKQPMLKVIKSIRKQFVKGGKKIKQIPEIVYLVPEYVSPTGMTDDQRSDFKTMQILAPHTKLSPYQRVSKCQEVVDDLNQVEGLVEIKNPKRLQGYCLDKPDLQYHGAMIQPDNRGNIRHRGILKQPFFFKDWIFAYSISKQQAYDHDQANNAAGLLRKCGETYGVEFKSPGFIVIDSGSIDVWKEQLRIDAEKNGTPQIIVVFLAPFEEKFYGELKRFITNELKCPSQFIKRKTLNNPKGAMSAGSKIVIQMNIKVGAVPWKVQKRSEYFHKKNVMYGALSISKGSKGYTLAFVGTINSDCTRVFSDYKIGIKSKQSISVDILSEIFVSWAKNYFITNNKTVPDLIILYRQGLSIPQIKMQVPRMQIPALESMIKIIGKKTATKNYNPEITIVAVNKKINTRYFLAEGGDPRQRQKFIPNLINPDSGSIMVQSLSQDDMYDFYLAAQNVTQGTCTPTRFIVAYDTSKMPQEALITFTFEQCFNYYNWEGAVRVPACLQCADKLAKLGSQYMKEDIVQSGITKKHYFL